ncbi:MAG: capsular biosynthesis protein, partial [Bryobacteraceae bacterium]|nr:capsular biosynthesis protein [Bryobacteraceae bacterium]
ANGIRVVLASVMPVSDYFKPQTRNRPMEKIKALNEWIRAYAVKNDHIYVDYFSALTDESGLLKKDYTYDGLHPNSAGYDVILPVAQKAVDQALRSER